MGCFDRPERKRRPIILKSERLNRLDHELMVDRSKDFDYLYLNGHGMRVRVCVMQDVDNKCYATAEMLLWV